MFDIKIKKHDLFGFISLNGEMDLSSSFKLKDAVNSLLYDDIKNVIIDFSALKYIDSSGIGALLRINSEFSIPDRNLWLINITGQVNEVIRLAKLNNYFPISTLKDAIDTIIRNK